MEGEKPVQFSLTTAAHHPVFLLVALENKGDSLELWVPWLPCVDYITIIGDRNYSFDGLSCQGVVAKKLKNT